MRAEDVEDSKVMRDLVPEIRFGQPSTQNLSNPSLQSFDHHSPPMLSSRWLSCARRSYLSVHLVRPTHTLANSALIRPLGNPAPQILEEDFQLLPRFYDLSETRQLLSAALWKLDRGDSTRRRHRAAPRASDVVSEGKEPPLADLFYGDYGFEPVRPRNLDR